MNALLLLALTAMITGSLINWENYISRKEAVAYRPIALDFTGLQLGAAGLSLGGIATFWLVLEAYNPGTMFMIVIIGFVGALTAPVNLFVLVKYVPGTITPFPSTRHGAAATA